MSRLKIVVLDDDQDDREFFETSLESLCLDCELEQYSSGTEFIKKLSDPDYNVPNIIFLDINLRIISGFEVLEAIKKAKRFENTKVIMYSTSGFHSDVERAKEGGASGYIVKPLSIKDLTFSTKGAIDAVLNQPAPPFYFYNI